MTAPRLSAILIVKDEARDLPDCLASLAFCQEIVVVDSGSRDGTQAIARAAGACSAACHSRSMAERPPSGPAKSRSSQSSSAPEAGMCPDRMKRPGMT